MQTLPKERDQTKPKTFKFGEAKGSLPFVGFNGQKGEVKIMQGGGHDHIVIYQGGKAICFLQLTTHTVHLFRPESSMKPANRDFLFFLDP